MARMNKLVAAGIAAAALAALLVACDNPLLEEIRQRVADYQANLPVADFSVSRSSGCVPLNVTFTDLSTSGGPVTAWSWNFGDGSTSTAQNPTHRYTRQGIFTVTLNVSGPGGSDSDSTTVRVATFDVNGDGYSDYAVGQPNYGSHLNGRVYIYSGNDGSPLRNLDDVSEEDYFGYALADAGDVNADGYGDLIVGAYGYPNASARGRAFVYSGLDGSQLYERLGEANFQYFGMAVSGVGDVDGDGHSDFAVGAPSYPDQYSNRCAGKFYVYSGADGNLLHSEQGWAATSPATGGDRLGSSIGPVGDLNGDGRDEFIVGAPEANSTNGSAYIYSFNGTSFYKYRTIDSPGDPAYDEFGMAVNGCGDVNADGVPDYIVGDPGWGATNYGRAHVYSGSSGSQLYFEEGDYGNDNFGVSVSGADFNQDGYSDYLVGNSYYQSATYRGRVVAFSGQTGNALYILSGENNGDRFGQSVSAGGDINGDGNPDFVVGAYGFSSNAGKAYVYSGASGSELTTRTKTGTGTYSFGRSVSNGR